MKTISLQQAHKILTDCSAVVWEDNNHFVTYPSLSGITGEDDNQFLYLSGTDEDGYEYSAYFEEGNNKQVRVEGASMFLTDNEGEEVQLSILVPYSQMSAEQL